MTVTQLRKALGEHRLDKGLSYERLSARISLERINPHTVRRFIEGTGEPSKLTIRAIETYLKKQKVAA